MKILSDIKKDVRTRNKNPGGYEWWYFDAVSGEGLTIVVIFYDGNPFSKRYIQSLKSDRKAYPSDFPAITISLYQHGEPVFYCFEETEPAQAEISDQKPYGRVGNNTFELMHLSDHDAVYQLQLDQVLPNGEKIAATLEFRVTGADRLAEFPRSQPHATAERHQWNLTLPRCHVSGKVYLNDVGHDFSGTGYHDHNMGPEPLKESFTEWYWGRYHLNQGTLIYYLMRDHSGWNHNAWFIGKDGTLLTDKITCQLHGKEMNLFGLVSAGKLIFRSKSAEWVVQRNKRLDNGPFYQRYEDRVSGKLNGKRIQGYGLSEYLKPSRIYSKIFWPLVDMRIRYPGKLHWVQKSRRLHRWTWMGL